MKISRRRLLATGAALVGGSAVYSAAGAYRFRVSKYTKALRGLQKPVRVVQLSDLHFGPYIHAGSVKRFFLEATLQKPDLIVITGDLIDGTSRKLGRKRFKEALAQDHEAFIQTLALLKAPLGIKVCWGNHDYYDFLGMTKLYSAFPDYGMQVLVNQNVEVRPDLYIAGVDDAWEGNPNALEAVEGVPSGPACLMLCHNPDYSFSIPARADFTLCGHTHGGQVKLPLVGAPWTPSKYGERFSEGFFTDPINMFVSRGLGVTGFPLRFGSVPELVVFDFVPQISA
jgi:uncharacterized protein